MAQSTNDERTRKLIKQSVCVAVERRRVSEYSAWQLDYFVLRP